jgi:hypothetical protein
MSDDLLARIDETLAFARYLSWADLMSRLFEAEMRRDISSNDSDELRDHEWRWFGLMCYWYSSVHVVVEAWDELGFSDPVVDRLLAHPAQFRSMLRRHRNAVFHYQRSLVDPKLVEFLAQGAAHVYWVRALHEEFIRFLFQDLVGRMVTDDQRAALRQEIESMLHWFPSTDPPEVRSLERTVAAGRQLLADHPDDQSEHRRELESFLRTAEEALRNAKCNWAALRSEILREAGVDETIRPNNAPEPSARVH